MWRSCISVSRAEALKKRSSGLLLWFSTTLGSVQTVSTPSSQKSLILEAGSSNISTSRAGAARCVLVTYTTRTQHYHAHDTQISARSEKIQISSHSAGTSRAKPTNNSVPALSRVPLLCVSAHTLHQAPRKSRNTLWRAQTARGLCAHGEVPWCSSLRRPEVMPVWYRCAQPLGFEREDMDSEHAIALQEAAQPALRICASCSVAAAQGGRGWRSPTRFSFRTSTRPRTALYSQICTPSARAHMFGEFQLHPSIMYYVVA